MDKQIEKFEFRVIDNNTGEEADIEEIAFTEDWAEGLIHCDMEGFAILEDGSLVLLDECGNCAYCPSGRFSIIPEGAVVLTRAHEDKIFNDYVEYIKKVRKEMAEKFAEKIQDYLNDKVCEEFGDNACDVTYFTIDVDKVISDVFEIAKEITEGEK